ncbi:22403_t:CDS:2, partial [Rhizophagus irregularis]
TPTPRLFHESQVFGHLLSPDPKELLTDQGTHFIMALAPKLLW